MKLTPTMLINIGLQDLMQGTPIVVPCFLKKDVDLLYQNNKHIIAFMAHRYLNDYRIHARVMIILNQLVRYYHCEIVIYCLSYRALISHEKLYLTFKKKPIHNEN